MKMLVQIVMTVLAVGMSVPTPASLAATPEPVKTCCSAESASCPCPTSQPCSTSCTLHQAQDFDKQIPARTARAYAPIGDTLLYALAPTPVKILALVPVAHQREWNASPPFGGSPPQALLCLWRI
jgi:hypothetical protein